MVTSGLIIPTLLMIMALLWLYARRLGSESYLRRTAAFVSGLPAPAWMLLGAIAFALPVLEYWVTARSHGNALAGYLPWADATEYFQCSEVFLLGLDGPAHCGKRPYYFTFFADLLWLTGNRLQPALLLQALILGAAAVLFARVIARTMSAPSALAAYAVFFVYAAALCSGLVMTENIGLILGVFGLLLLLRHMQTPAPALFLTGVALLAAAMSARPGPLFVLPALGAWYLFYGSGSFSQRFLVAVSAGAVSALAMALVASPILLAGGTFGSTHSNFSYSLYGLVVGGKGWLQVTIDHPEIFNRSDGIPQTDKVYQLALQSLAEKPHLFVLGYIKGIAKYFNDLFRYATDFKLLRLLLLLIPWMLGAWYALKRWREPAYSMLLAIEAGIIISSPFLIYDGHNRAFASTVAVDAAFVALGMVWIGERLKVIATDTKPVSVSRRGNRGLVAAGVTALFMPVVLFAAIKPASPPVALSPPQCEAGQKSVTLKLSQGTLMLPLVAPGEERLFPLAVRADHFGARFHQWVHAKEELGGKAGTTLVWGLRLEQGSRAALTYFRWKGAIRPESGGMGFCVNPPPAGKRIGTGISADTR